MSGSVFARSIRLFADRNLSPSAVGEYVATQARAARDELIRSGQAPNSYRTFVDGREGAQEESVRKVILYQFNLLGPAAAFALAYAIGRSPVDSGAYRKAWFVAVDGHPWTGDLDKIPAGSEVMITNPLPYHRKIDVGAMTMRVNGTSKIVEATRQAVMKRWPNLKVWRQFVTLPGGYVLKGHQRLFPAKQDPRSSVFRNGGRYLAPRKDLMAGQPMTYPAVVILDR